MWLCNAGSYRYYDTYLVRDWFNLFLKKMSNFEILFDNFFKFKRYALKFKTMAFSKKYTILFLKRTNQYTTQQQRLIPLGGVDYMDQLPP